MLHDYYNMSADDLQYVPARLEVPGLNISDTNTDVGKTHNATSKSTPANFDLATSGKDMADNSLTDVVLAEPLVMTAQPNDIMNPPSKDMQRKPKLPEELLIQPPRSLGQPEPMVLNERISELGTLIKQESTQAPTLEAPSVHKKLDYDEESGSDDDDSEIELSDDDSEIELSDDDIGAHDEFKESIDVVHRGFNNPYDPSTEETPNLPAYHPAFSNVERLCQRLLGDAARMLKNSEYQDAKIRDIFEQAVGKQTITPPKPRRIGLVGDSGVGKSSLINSLLDTPQLAFQGEDGSACTCVITEFQQAWPTQNAPFEAEIDLFEPGQIKGILTNHYQAYYKYHFQSNKDLDQDALHELEGHATTALDAFQALFANHQEFQTENSGREFLRRGKSVADCSVPHKLYTWVETLVSKYGAKNGTIHLTADTAAELARTMEPFVKINTSVIDDEEPCPSPWPIVQLVRVGFQSPLLKRGLIIADLPGLSDINKIRTKMTNQYLRRCDYVLLIAPIARVQTDDNVHKRLFDFSRAFGLRKALLCTKIDDMPLNARVQQLAPTPEALDHHSNLSRAYQFANTEKTRLTKALKGLKGKAKKDMQKQINKLGLRRKIFGALLREALIVLRSQKVSMAMRKKYKSLTSDLHTLNILCVSNQDYSMHKDGYDEDNIPVSLSTTGIPRLRFMLSTMPAKIRLDVLTQFYKGTVPELISSLDVWSHRTTNQRRLELREVVDKPREAIGEVVGRYINDMRSELENSILKTIRDSYEGWVARGIQAAKQWETWHAATYNAWIRNGGAHKTKAKGYYSWNNEIIEPVATKMIDAWPAFDLCIKEAGEKCHNSLAALLEGILESLKAMPGVAVLPMTPFLMSLAPKKVKLQTYVEEFAEELLAVSDNTRLDVITSDDDAYIMQALLSLYAACNRKTGKSISVARRALIGHAFEIGEPYAKIGDHVKDAMETAFTHYQIALLEKIQDVFDSVVADFDEMFVVEEVPDPKRDALCQQIQEFVIQANARLDGPIAREFAAATSLSAPLP